MLNEDQWKEIGDLTKLIRKDLFRLMDLSQKAKMRKSETNSIVQTVKRLDIYRNKAENYMFSQGGEDTNVFYGDSDA